MRFLGQPFYPRRFDGWKEAVARVFVERHNVEHTIKPLSDADPVLASINLARRRKPVLRASFHFVRFLVLDVLLTEEHHRFVFCVEQPAKLGHCNLRLADAQAARNGAILGDETVNSMKKTHLRDVLQDQRRLKGHVK